MDIKKALLERRLRSVVRDGDGRRLLDFLMESDYVTAKRMLCDLGLPVGPALADAIRVARTDEELKAAIVWAGLFDDPMGLDEVRRVLRQGSLAARPTALSTLLAHGTPDDATYIAERLTDQDERMRSEVYDALSEREMIGGPDSLPPVASDALAAERTRRAEADAEAFRRMLDGPLDRVTAAKALVGLCNEMDATYADPVAPDAGARRESLREDIARVGRAAYEQGGDAFMLEIARLVASASSHGSFLEREWTGIGGWMG